MFTAIAVIAILFVIHLVYSSYDVRLVPGKFKIREKSYGTGTTAITYYNLYVFEKLVWFVHSYKIVGEDVIDPMFGYKIKFIEFKFNSIEDAEAYYQNVYKK